MNKQNVIGRSAVLSCGLFLSVVVGCSSDKPKEPEKMTQQLPGGSRTVSTMPGEAGGTMEETYTATATITAVEPATRRITLENPDGSTATFTAGPEIRNFDQLRAGDKVKATLVDRLVVFVNSDATPGMTHTAAVGRAPAGAKPGAIVGESYEVVATITAIDATNRTATLQFTDGGTRQIPIRKDVDLSKYKVGDKVVIQVSEQLSLLVNTPQ